MSVSENKWRELKERQDACINAFIDGSFNSENVLRARLRELGLWGDYLESEVKQAVARKPTRAKNWNCDNDKCRDAKGETRLYPIGGGANMILCPACWAYENRYRLEHGIATRNPEAFPEHDWAKAEVYKKAGE